MSINLVQFQQGLSMVEFMQQYTPKRRPTAPYTGRAPASSSALWARTAPPLSVDSVGLLQLSYEDQSAYHLEPLDRQRRTLEDPLVNLRCSMTIMAHLIARDRVVARGTGDHSRGAAAYWSVLREGSWHDLAEIKTLTKKNAGIP
jgi:hypothetical protein